MARTTLEARPSRPVTTVVALLALGVVLVLLRQAYLHRESAWVAGCAAQGGWVETVPKTANPLVVGDDAPTLTCWSHDGRVLDRRH